MYDSQSPNNNKCNYKIKEYKICAAYGCDKPAYNQVNIIYINKIGFFCDKCKNDLTKLQLVTELSENNDGR